MKHPTKLVTGILLITLSAMPAFAAIPCQQSARSMPCCDGVMCPMMAMMPVNGAISHRGMNDVPASCCKIRARSLVAVTDHQLTDTAAAMANSGAGTAIPLAQLTQPRREVVGAVDLRCSRRTQAVLSAFLI